jgi:hypothetical protein
LCDLVEKSENSVYAHLTTVEIANVLRAIMHDVSTSGSLDKSKLNSLLAPTGSIQEISIKNRWGKRMLRLAQEIDKLQSHLLKEQNFPQT